MPEDEELTPEQREDIAAIAADAAARSVRDAARTPADRLLQLDGLIRDLQRLKHAARTS